MNENLNCNLRIKIKHCETKIDKMDLTIRIVNLFNSFVKKKKYAVVLTFKKLLS